MRMELSSVYGSKECVFVSSTCTSFLGANKIVYLPGIFSAVFTKKRKIPYDHNVKFQSANNSGSIADSAVKFVYSGLLGHGGSNGVTGNDHAH